MQTRKKKLNDKYDPLKTKVNIQVNALKEIITIQW